MKKRNYIIITPAYNEEKYIEKLIISVINQNWLPKTWIIVNDRSNDNTEDIIKTYLKKYNFIKYLKIAGKPEHNFGAKVRAINTALDTVKLNEYDYIGILDADISFGKDYFESIINVFGQNERLGLAGGKIMQFVNNRYHEHIKSPDSVAGAVQLFRRECFLETGGFVPREYGGEDSLLEMTARMKGWQVKTISEQNVIHHGKVTYAGFTPRFRRGRSFYTLGYHPLFHATRCIYRLKEKPFIIGSIVEVLGYIYAFFCDKIEISQELKNFIRKEQTNKLKALLNLFNKTSCF